MIVFQLMNEEQERRLTFLDSGCSLMDCSEHTEERDKFNSFGSGGTGIILAQRLHELLQESYPHDSLRPEGSGYLAGGGWV